MAASEKDIAGHYARGPLERAVMDAIGAAGLDPKTVGPEDLAPVDEFHVGGIEAVTDLAGQLRLRPGARVLDVGCGVGGPARLLAHRFGWEVTGIDLTPEFVALARFLTGLTGLDGKVRFEAASALDLPFEPGRFEAATMIHVGMNIADKVALCAEVHRVLAPGGTFALFDIMRTGGGDIEFPVPWAPNETMSFVADPAAYRDALGRAGFEIAAERDRSGFATAFFRRVMAEAAASDPSPLGLHILMGADGPTKLRNIAAAIEAGAVAPVEMICRRH